jgi:hypothetical protein
MVRPALRPGLHVVRRDDGHLQLGVDEPDRLVLRDRPGLYDALVAPERPAPDDLRPVLEDLAARGWIVDAAEPDGATHAARSAVVLDADPALAGPLGRICAAVRVALVAEPHARVVPRLVATLGEPGRSTADPLVRADVPHLWLAVLPRSIRLGPFVDPGRSACLRCVDAHLGERDVRRATVLHQLEELPTPDFRWDPCLLELGAAWALRDVVRRLDGGVPSLRSATVTVTTDLQVTRHEWLRHPHCGCAWG